MQRYCKSKYIESPPPITFYCGHLDIVDKYDASLSKIDIHVFDFQLFHISFILFVACLTGGVYPSLELGLPQWMFACLVCFVSFQTFLLFFCAFSLFWTWIGVFVFNVEEIKKSLIWESSNEPSQSVINLTEVSLHLLRDLILGVVPCNLV